MKMYDNDLLLQDSSPFSALCALTELIWLKDTSMLTLEITVIITEYAYSYYYAPTSIGGDIIK